MPKNSLFLHELTIEDTRKIMQDYGSDISEERLRAGLEQGVFPFGYHVRCRGGGNCYTVYAADLMRYIEAHSEKQETPEWFKMYEGGVQNEA